MVVRGTLEMFLTTNTLMATGGMTIPTIWTMAMKMQNHMGSYPDLHRDGEENGRRDNDEGQVLHESHPQKVDKGDDHHDDRAGIGKTHGEVRSNHRNPAHGQEVAEYGGPGDERQDHAGRIQRLPDRLEKVRPVDILLGKGQEEDRQVHTACLRRGKEALHQAHDKDNEDQDDPGDFRKRLNSLLPWERFSLWALSRIELAPAVDDGEEEEGDEEPGKMPARKSLPIDCSVTTPTG